MKRTKMIKAGESYMLEGEFHGYIWKSDQNPHEVEVCKGETHRIVLDATANPFVIEGQLYDDGKKKSYSIKYVDGAYYCVEYDVVDETGVQEGSMVEHEYIASFDGAPGRLRFREYWQEQENSLCLDFKQLFPAEFVFVGFE